MTEVTRRVHQARTAAWDAGNGKMLQPVNPLHILLAEDDECTRLVVKQLLKRSGFTVTTAKDGQEALDTLQAGKGVDLILTDVVMPQVSGIQLTSAIGQTPDLQHLPVVVMSSDAQSDLVREAFAVGAADFLVKPIRRNEVVTLWQHVWRSMQALAGAGGGRIASGCNGNKHSAWHGASGPAFGAPAVAVKAEASAVPGKSPQLPLCGSSTAQEQPACPACSPTEAALKVCGDNMAQAESWDTSRSNSGVSTALNTRAALPHYAGQLEGTREAPPDYGSERATGQACAALPRIVSAPCLLSVSQEGGSQNRLVASSLKREREAAEPFGSAEGHHKKRHVTGALLPSTSDDSGDSAETVQLEQSSAAPLAAAAAADGNVPALDISSRCASLGVRACVLMPVDLEIAPLDLGSSGSAAFCIGWQAADLAVQHKFSLRQPEDSACMRVDGKHDAPWEQSKRVKGGDEGPVRGACTAKESQHRSLGGRTQKCAADIEVAPGDPATWAANRKAALQKLREKKKLRSFQKKVRYESRRKLAESRPRVRGQFVKASAAAQAG